MFKLGCMIDGEWRAYSHAPVFSVEHPDKVISTAPGGDPLIFGKLSEQLTEPLLLLYVLHTPRGEGLPGRYQSEDMSHGEVRSFLHEFADFLAIDGRFDLWVHSPEDPATIVWDRHDLIHVYGPADRTIETLRSLGFHSGTPSIPSPHCTNYHRELDDQARNLLSGRTWRHSPLREEDEQF